MFLMDIRHVLPATFIIRIGNIGLRTLLPYINTLQTLVAAEGIDQVIQVGFQL
jgi:hypothetical protein